MVDLQCGICLVWHSNKEEHVCSKGLDKKFLAK